MSPVVDTQHLGAVGHHEGLDLSSALQDRLDGVDEVVFLLGVVGLQFFQGFQQVGGLEEINPGVDLVDAPLLLRGVLFLDDAHHLPLGAPQDAAVTVGFLHPGGQERRGPSP